MSADWAPLGVLPPVGFRNGTRVFCDALQGRPGIIVPPTTHTPHGLEKVRWDTNHNRQRESNVDPSRLSLARTTNLDSAARALFQLLDPFGIQPHTAPRFEYEYKDGVFAVILNDVVRVYRAPSLGRHHPPRDIWEAMSLALYAASGLEIPR